jgi:hypothetical protein
MSRPQALLLCALAGISAARSQAAPAAVDADLLEFLGSIGEEDDWQDFLEQKPVKAATAKAAKDPQKIPAKTPVAPPAPATSKEKDK